VVDYRKFLAKEETFVVPWLGATTAEAAGGRRLCLTQRPDVPGWYSVAVKGRSATVRGPADAPALSGLVKVRGWLSSGRLVREGGLAELVHLPPADEAPRFSPATCRRWHSGELLFEGLEFETEVEAQVREALALERPLQGIKGVPAPLRAAFALAVLEAASRRTGVPVSPAEVRAHLSRIADGGVPAALEVLRALTAERALALRELEALERRRRELLLREELRAERELRRTRHERVAAELHAARGRRGGDDGPASAELALEQAGARLESARRLNGNQLEVVFRFMDQRFISLVDATTLQVIDSGICLGHPPSDALLTLDSLPAVIKEAIDTDALVILRWP
jgi:hypothetical protein